MLDQTRTLRVLIGWAGKLRSRGQTAEFKNLWYHNLLQPKYHLPEFRNYYITKGHSGQLDYCASEGDLRSYEVTKAVTNKAQKKFWGSNGIRTHDLRDTGVVIYQLRYEAGLWG